MGGAELAYQAAPQIPGGHIGVLSAVGRYTGSDFTFSSTLANSGALHACYYQKCSQDLSVGAELEMNLRAGESRASVGYKVEIPRAGPIPFSLALSGVINHPKNSFMLGAGLIIG